jgi:arginine decarboxylase
MIDSSFITTTWYLGNNKRFIMLAVNRWNETYERVLLGGLTCDSVIIQFWAKHNDIYLRNTIKKNIVHRVFNTGAYQETIGGVYTTA